MIAPARGTVPRAPSGTPLPVSGYAEEAGTLDHAPHHLGGEVVGAEPGERALRAERIRQEFRHQDCNALQYLHRKPRRRTDVVLTRTTIEQAARQAATQPGIDAVILFGSRVRGDARPGSDWDLCVVGDRKPHDLIALLGLADGIAPPIDLLWRSSRELREETREGSVWAEIVRHGAVLAGDPDLLRNISIEPMKNADIQWALLAAVDAATGCAEASTVAPDAPRTHAELQAVKGTVLSARAAEFLSRGFLGLMGAQPGGGHDVSGDARILERHAQVQASGSEREIMDAMIPMIREMDRGTHEAHAAWYSRKAEPSDQWQQRARNVMRAHTALIAGALQGEGTLRKLERHARTQSVREGLEASARSAAYHADRLLGRDGAALGKDMCTALKAWRDGCRHATTPGGHLIRSSTWSAPHFGIHRRPLSDCSKVLEVSSELGLP